MPLYKSVAKLVSARVLFYTSGVWKGLRYMKKKNFVLLFFFLIAGGTLSTYLKYELLWDFANYHYYNPWAFLNGRVNFDVAVAGLNAFFNPLPDVPLYLLIKYFNNYPDFIYFVQGMWFGALAFTYAKIISLFFDFQRPKGKILSVITFLIGITSWSCFMQIGTSTNEIPLAFLVLTGLYLLLKQFSVSIQSLTALGISGFVLGMAMGLKLTNVTYCIASGISLILFYRKLQRPLAALFWFSFSGVAGFLIVNGFWMKEMWEHFQNPFFPFANEIFKSEYMEQQNFSDRNYVPISICELLFFPFKFNHSEGSAFIADYRLAFSCIIFVAYLIYLLIGKVRGKDITRKTDMKLIFLMVWVLTAYIFWVNVFTILRYAVPIFLMLSIFIVKSGAFCLPRRQSLQIVYFSIVNILIFQFVMTPYFSQPWGYRKDITSEKKENSYNRFVYVEHVNIPENSLILMYSNRTSAILPYWGQDKKRIRGIKIAQSFYLVKTAQGDKDFFEYNKKWKKYKEDVIREHKGPKIALVTCLSQFFLRDKYLEGMVCRKLRNNMAEWVLCVPPEFEKSVWSEA